MAGMGSTGTIYMTKQMMVNAQQAITEYLTTIGQINDKLSGEISGLIPSSFSGSAATEFNNFYTNSIVPVVTTNLNSMMENLNTICEQVKNNIPGDQQGVDDQLGEGNKSAGGGAAAPTA